MSRAHQLDPMPVWMAAVGRANANHQAATAAKSLEKVRKVQAAGLLTDLPHRERQAAELRLAYPDVGSLAELAGHADPPVTRAVLQTSLAKVYRRADKLQGGMIDER